MGTVTGGGAGGGRVQFTPAFVQRSSDIFREGQKIVNADKYAQLVANGSNGEPPLNQKERDERHREGQTIQKFLNDWKDATMKHFNDAYQISAKIGPNGERVAWKTAPSQKDLRAYSRSYSDIVKGMVAAKERGDKKGYNTGATKLARSIENFLATNQIVTKGGLAASAIRGLNSVVKTEQKLVGFLQKGRYASIAKMDPDGSKFAQRYASIAKRASLLKGKGKFSSVKRVSQMGKLTTARVKSNIANVKQAIAHTQAKVANSGIRLQTDKKGGVKAMAERKSIVSFASQIKKDIGITVSVKNIRAAVERGLRRPGKKTLGE